MVFAKLQSLFLLKEKAGTEDLLLCLLVCLCSGLLALSRGLVEKDHAVFNLKIVNVMHNCTPFFVWFFLLVNTV